MSIAAAVLVGGLSSRMGRNKAMLALGRITALQHVLRAAREAQAGPVCLVGREGEAGPYQQALPELELATDDPARPRCALAGIEAALRWAPGRVLVLACDLPLAPPALLARLISLAPEADVVALAGPRGPEPLVAVYGQGCLGPIERAFAEGRLKARSFHGEVRVELLPESDRLGLDPKGYAFWNMNTPQDYERIRAVID